MIYISSISYPPYLLFTSRDIVSASLEKLLGLSIVMETLFPGVKYFLPKRIKQIFALALRVGQEEENGGLKEHFGTILTIQLATWVVGLLAM